MANYVEQLKGYVKFLRGTPAAWATIEEPHADTLYFISEPNAETGKLYLGKKLLSDGSISITESTLGDLKNVAISNGVVADSLLVYNAETEQWEDKPLGTVLSAVVAVMVGATAEKDGIAGLVPVPVAGQQNLFLQGNGTWANPVASLFGEDDDPTKTIREIAQEEVANLLGTGDPDKLDTLKDALDWIQNHETILDVETAEERLDNLEAAVFDQPDPEDEEKTIPGLVTVVSNLTTQVQNIENNYTELSNALRWTDLESDGTV